MKNFLYTTGIFLLLLSPATCNYEESSLLRTEADGTIIDEIPESGTDNNSSSTIVPLDCTTSEDGEPIIKTNKP